MAMCAGDGNTNPSANVWTETSADANIVCWAIQSSHYARQSKHAFLKSVHLKWRHSLCQKFAGMLIAESFALTSIETRAMLHENGYAIETKFVANWKNFCRQVKPLCPLVATATISFTTFFQ